MGIGHRSLRLVGGNVAYSNIDRKTQSDANDGNSNLFLQAASKPDQSLPDSVVQLGRRDGVGLKHSEEKPPLSDGNSAPKIKEGQFVRVINELRDAWLAARRSAGWP